MQLVVPLAVKVKKSSRGSLVTVVKKERIKVMLVIGNLEILKIMAYAKEVVRAKIGVLHLLSIMKIRIVITSQKIQHIKLVTLQKLDPVLSKREQMVLEKNNLH
jgi:hypothetical protein